MEMIFKDIGKYQQVIWINEDGKVVDIQCTCMHGTIRRTAWKDNKGLCKHIKEAIKNVKVQKN